MIRFIAVFGLLSMPFISWVFTRVWILAGRPWCLDVYPVWLDRFIYAMAEPYLSAEMIEAATQMEFIEVLIVATLLLELTFSVFMFFLYKNSSSK